MIMVTSLELEPTSLWCVQSKLFSLFFTGDVPLDVLTQIVATISDPSAMLGPEVRIQILFSFFAKRKRDQQVWASD